MKTNIVKMELCKYDAMKRSAYEMQTKIDSQEKIIKGIDQLITDKIQEAIKDKKRGHYFAYSSIYAEDLIKVMGYDIDAIEEEINESIEDAETDETGGYAE